VTETPAIPRFDASTPAAEISAALLVHGAAIIERLLDDDMCDTLLAELQPWFEQTPPGADAFSGLNTRRTGALLTRCPSSAGLVTHPTVLEVVETVLWPKKTTFQLHLTQSIAIGPDSPAQYLHRDQWCFDMFPFPREVDVEIATIWALTDFTEDVGATRLVPDSHRTPDSRTYTPADTVPATMPRGSVVMYLGSTVHGGGANTSDRTRFAINIDYVLGWLRQEENQYLSYTLNEVRAMPERLQRLLGYEIGAYALGYIDGGRSPLDLVRPADAHGAAAHSFGASD
jgi:ectoine hydroxylase-related dioxygenase (phytanoyl-CoA dioxygenase family)